MDDSWAREWIEDYATAWRGADADIVAELFTEDAVYRSRPSGRRRRSRGDSRLLA